MIAFRAIATSLLAVAFACVLPAGAAPSGGGATVVGGGGSSLFDRVWERARLYRDDGNPLIQEFSVAADFFLQWAYGSSNQGQYESGDLPEATRWGDTDVRVWRLGFRSQLLHDLRLTGMINVNPDCGPLYRDIYDLSLVYSRGDAFHLGAGKQKGRFFSQEYRTPTRELIVFDQSLLVNALVPRGVTGIWADGDVGKWTYALAGFAGDGSPEFSRFDAGAVLQANLGHDFAEDLNLERAVVRLDYQGSTSGDNAFGPGAFGHAFSLNTTVQNGRFYGYTDLLGGIGRGSQGDVWGITLTPTYFLVERFLQLVLRYQHAHGGDEGLRLPRYEALARDIRDTGSAGSDFNAVYLGLNWYLHGHLLKLMSGVEYVDLAGGPKEFLGWTWLAGVRLAF